MNISKKVFVLIFFLTTCVICYAQKIQLGIKAGGVISGFYDSEIEVISSAQVGSSRTLIPRAGFEIGIASNILMKRILYFSPEIKFITKGGATLGVNYPDINDFRLKSNYLSLPLLFKIKPIKWLSIEIGPEFSYLLSYDFEVAHDFRQYLKSRSKNWKEINNANEIEISANLGISFDVHKRINLGIIYSYSFTRNSTFDLIDNTGSTILASEIYNRYLSFSARYYVFSK
jgi:hypothetical protein